MTDFCIHSHNYVSINKSKPIWNISTIHLFIDMLVVCTKTKICMCCYVHIPDFTLPYMYIPF